MLPRVNLISTDNDKYLLFSTSDVISTSLYHRGVWDEVVLKLSELFVREEVSPVVFDIGANLGAYTIPIAKSISKNNGAVYSFEPQRIIYYQLCGNVFLNSLDNVYVFNNAISSEIGSIEMPEIDYFSNWNIGAFSIDEESRKKRGVEYKRNNDTFSVGTLNLNSITGDHNVSVVKIDVEGFELDVLNGAHDFLERYNYPPFFFECWELDWFADKRKALFDEVKKLGYDVFKIGDEDYIAQNMKHKKYFDIKFESGRIEINKIK
ncbi:FkbM family methyltransferase [Pectobacterium colocasium]|uniref:FkbM family methyltransferase n=1 Tax=Pectobacterium colocasium TaxID=2878098 RepID=UPI001CD2A140|nr:FkbM family methyltransferase [Pectobacterium colocasium]